MKSMRERYFENFKKVQIPADNRRGFKTIYQYNTDWYGWDKEERELRRDKVVFWILEGASIVVYFAAALQNTSFNVVRLTSGLAIISIVAWIAELWGVFRFTTVRSPMMVSDYKEITNFIECGTILRVILLTAATVIGFIMCVRSGSLTGTDTLVGIGHFASAACSLLIILIFRTIGYDLYRNNEGKPGARK